MFLWARAERSPIFISHIQSILDVAILDMTILLDLTIGLPLTVFHNALAMVLDVTITLDKTIFSQPTKSIVISRIDCKTYTLQQP